MAAVPLPERPTSRRPFPFWGLVYAALALAAAPLLVAFGRQDTVATVSDDSVSYLAMARWFAGTADAHLTPWLPWHSHFPPLFPMLLAATGGDADFTRAHLVVSLFAAVAPALVAAYSARRLGSGAAGLAVALVFMATPTAWLSTKGILTEPLFLVLTLAALLVHERWLAHGEGRPGAWLGFGVLVAAAYATRSIAVTLLAAFVVAEAMRALGARRVRWKVLALVLAPSLAAAVAWPLLRPGGHTYAVTIGTVVDFWRDQTAFAVSMTTNAFAEGWLSSFQAEGDRGAVATFAFAALGVLALAGAVRAAARNRLDGWYVLFTAVLVLVWPFAAENMRRLLYPIVPLAFLHAAEICALGVARVRPSLRGFAGAAAFALPAVLMLPALALYASKWRDREPLVAGTRQGASEVTDYYRIMNTQTARAFAAKHTATLGGLERLRVDTPPEARVMWMRPEYVALLGGRAGVPYYYAWDAVALARAVHEQGVQYIVAAGMSKSDLAHKSGNGAAVIAQSQPYAQVAVALGNPVTREDEFLLLRVDPAALEAYLARAGAPSGPGSPGSR